MRRRRYLASVAAAAALAGCSGDGDSGDGTTTGETTTTATTTTTTTPANVLRRVSVASTDDLKSGLETTLAAETVQSTVTPEHTAVVRVTLTNDADFQRSYVTTAREVFFGPISESRSPALALVESSDGRDPNNLRVGPECWRLESGLSFETVEKSAVLDAGESASVDLAVWGHHKNDGEDCLPAGTYRFTTDYDAIRVDGDGKPPSFTWGFEVAVES